MILAKDNARSARFSDDSLTIPRGSPAQVSTRQPGGTVRYAEGDPTYELANAARFRRTVSLVHRLITPSQTILDVGPHILTRMLREDFDNVDSLGFDPDHLPRRPWENHFEQDLDTAPWKSGWGEYDLVSACEVLEDLKMPIRLSLRQLRSLIKPNGLILVTMPNAAALKNRLKLAVGCPPFDMHPELINGDLGHFREYTTSEVLSAAAAQGLQLYHFEAHSDVGHVGVGGRAYNLLCRHLPQQFRDAFVYVFHQTEAREAQSLIEPRRGTVLEHSCA